LPVCVSVGTSRSTGAADVVGAGTGTGSEEVSIVPNPVAGPHADVNATAATTQASRNLIVPPRNPLVIFRRARPRRYRRRA
jgi:hypothetical protein